MAPPVLIDRDFRRHSPTRDAYAVVTKDKASMRSFVLGCLSCLAIVGFGLFAYLSHVWP